MRMPDEQIDLFAQRLSGDRRRPARLPQGGRRDGRLRRPRLRHRAQAATPTKPGPGEKLAKEQVFRYGGGGYFQNDPASHDFNKDLYCSGVPALFAGLMVFNSDFVAVPWMATKVEGNKDGSVWTFNIRKDSRWSDNSPVSARDFEWSWKRQLDPASAAPYASFLYDIKNGEAFNKKKVTDPKEVGVRAKDDWTLEVTLEGPRGYFPVLAAYLAALPAYKPAVEKFGDKWTEAGNLVSNGPFTLEAWDHNKQIVLKKNPHYFGAKDVHLTRVIIPIIPVATGALPYENNELDLTALQSGDLKRLQSDPRMPKDVFRYPFPGTWYLLPQVTKPPFDNVKVRRAVSQAIDRENVVKVSQGLAIPAWSMIPPGFPGAIDDAKIKAIQKFDKKAALEQLKGTPFEGGKNWPKITLTMRDEALGRQAAGRGGAGGAARDPQHEDRSGGAGAARVPRAAVEAGPAVRLDPLVHGLPGPAQRVLRHLLRQEDDRQAPGVGQRRLRQGARGRARHARPKKRLEHYAKAEEIMQNDVGYVPVAWVVRYAAAKPWVKGIEKNKAGENVINGNIYTDMLQHIYIVEKG